MAFSAGAQTFFNVIRTEAGKVSGTDSEDGAIHIFKGIPFAAPPVGDLRWRPPQPVVPWVGVKECTTFAASLVQPKPKSFAVYTEEFLIKPEPISEDCLYLNVWTGAKSAREKRAVLVWVYGGGFISGGTNEPIYDGEAMARKGVIFVSVPYRVGILGFLAHPELTRESPDHTSGNYGLMDLIASLNWIKKNIAAFGGDPNNVTIAGQSAGSMSINYLVASPLAKGLFKRVIAESGAEFLPGPFDAASLEAAETAGRAAANKLNAPTLAELRKLPADPLLKQNAMRPIIDGHVLPATVQATFEGGKENKVDLLTGWNKDDAFVFSLVNAADYKSKMDTQYKDKAADVLKLYPAGSDSEAAVSQVRIARDRIFGVQNYLWANYEADSHRKVYLYRFNHAMPASEAFKKYGAFHTGEVPYALNNLKFVNRPFKSSDEHLADKMSSYWVNFAKTGNPNSPGLPAWPLYQENNKLVMLLDNQPAAENLPDKDALEFTVKQIRGN